MKRVLHSGLKSALRLGMASVPRGAYAHLVPRDVIGLCYHLVSDQRPAHVAHICPFKSTAAFRADMLWLRRHFEIIDYEEACRRKQTQTKNSRPAMLVTFDDGYRECLTVIGPILQELRIPATFFITTHFIDNHELFYRNAVSLCIEALGQLNNTEQASVAQQITHCDGATAADFPEIRQWLLGLGPENQSLIDATCRTLGIDTKAFLKVQRPYLLRDEIRFLRDAGFTIGAHGRVHCHLAGLPLERLEAELAGSCQAICELTGDSVVPFAFPFSGHRVDSHNLQQICHRHRHIGLLFDSRGILPSEPTTVHRISADAPPADANAQESTLPKLVQQAYASEIRQQWIAPLKSLLPFH